jgi:hypothetical protein
MQIRLPSPTDVATIKSVQNQDKMSIKCSNRLLLNSDEISKNSPKIPISSKKHRKVRKKINKYPNDKIDIKKPIIINYLQFGLIISFTSFLPLYCSH